MRRNLLVALGALLFTASGYSYGSEFNFGLDESNNRRIEITKGNYQISEFLTCQGGGRSENIYCSGSSQVKALDNAPSIKTYTRLFLKFTSQSGKTEVREKNSGWTETRSASGTIIWFYPERQSGGSFTMYSQHWYLKDGVAHYIGSTPETDPMYINDAYEHLTGISGNQCTWEHEGNLDGKDSTYYGSIVHQTIRVYKPVGLCDDFRRKQAFLFSGASVSSVSYDSFYFSPRGEDCNWERTNELTVELTASGFLNWASAGSCYHLSGVSDPSDGRAPHMHSLWPLEFLSPEFYQ